VVSRSIRGRESRDQKTTPRVARKDQGGEVVGRRRAAVDREAVGPPARPLCEDLGQDPELEVAVAEAEDVPLSRSRRDVPILEPPARGDLAGVVGVARDVPLDQRH
jgi:hypothetical protein